MRYVLIAMLLSGCSNLRNESISSSNSDIDIGGCLGMCWWHKSDSEKKDYGDEVTVEIKKDEVEK